MGSAFHGFSKKPSALCFGAMSPLIGGLEPGGLVVRGGSWFPSSSRFPTKIRLTQFWLKRDVVVLSFVDHVDPKLASRFSVWFPFPQPKGAKRIPPFPKKPAQRPASTRAWLFLRSFPFSFRSNPGSRFPKFQIDQATERLPSEPVHSFPFKW